LITQREIVSQKVSEDLMERASQFGVILDDISLVSYVVYLKCQCVTFSIEMCISIFCPIF